MMSSAAHNSHPRSKADRNQLLSPSPSTSDHGRGDAADKTSLGSMPEAESDYRNREANWFLPGRLFKIWAEGDAEIHRKEFVLLDSKNIEGPGLLVRIHGEEEEQDGFFYRAHVLVQNSKLSDFQVPAGPQGPKEVFLDDYESDRVRVAEHTWIHLEHVYNIPFINHKCIDCGVLSRQSLRKLRRCYVEWLMYRWELD